MHDARDYTVYWTLSVEAGIVFLYGLDIALNMYSMGVRDYFGVDQNKRTSLRLKAITASLPGSSNSKRMHIFKIIAVGVFVADVSFTYMNALQATRFSRFLRPIYATMWMPELRRWGLLIIRTVPHIWELVVLLVTTLVIWSVIGCLLFGKLTDTFVYDKYMNFK